MLDIEVPVHAEEDRLNPLLADWDREPGLPVFSRLRPCHFEPALEQAMQAHRSEIEAIGADPRPPAFDNTLVAWDRAGRRLQRLRGLFLLLGRCAMSPALQELQLRMAPRLAAHDSWVLTHAAVFKRIEALHGGAARRRLRGEPRRLLERVHQRCVAAGAQLDAADRDRLLQLQQRLALLQSQFAANLLAEEGRALLLLHDDDALAGLPAHLRRAMHDAAQRLGGDPGRHAVTPLLVEAFLTHSPHRELRRQAWLGWQGQGAQAGPHDNRPLVREILQLRQAQARLLGHGSYAALALAERMAGTPAAAQRLLHQLLPHAKAAAAQERQALCALQRQQGLEPGLQPWDWRHWSERQRQHAFGPGLGSEQLRAYCPLPRMLEAAFDCAGRLFGLRFERRERMRRHHPDVAVFGVRDADGSELGLLLLDLFTRPGKRGGAFVMSLRPRTRDGGPRGAVVALVANFDGTAPVLLTLREVRTLFHEMGHALHHLLCDVSYATLAGNQVPRDVVELPSQLFERWMWAPQVLARHARHWQTGDPLPAPLLAALLASRCHGQGAHLLRRLGSALVELQAHQQPGPIDDVEAFEAQALQALGMPADIDPLHRLLRFRHVFSSPAYAAGYYGYLWADVLAAEAYRPFREAGDAFDPALAARLRQGIYASGDSAPPRRRFGATRHRRGGLTGLLLERGFATDPDVPDDGMVTVGGGHAAD